MFTSEVQFGHAGACANAERETADAKNKALLAAGAHVPDSFDTLGTIIGYVSYHMENLFVGKSAVIIHLMYLTISSWLCVPPALIFQSYTHTLPQSPPSHLHVLILSPLPPPFPYTQ